MTDILTSIKNYFYPPEKTFIDYIKANPWWIAKGLVVGALAVYTGGAVLSVISWVPYIGIGFAVYKTAKNTHTGYSWMCWLKEKWDAWK